MWFILDRFIFRCKFGKKDRKQNKCSHFHWKTSINLITLFWKQNKNIQIILRSFKGFFIQKCISCPKTNVLVFFHVTFYYHYCTKWLYIIEQNYKKLYHLIIDNKLNFMFLNRLLYIYLASIIFFIHKWTIGFFKLLHLIL